MRIFKNRWFTRFADKQRITDEDLRDAIARAEKGLIDADLGGGVIKQRIARQGQGKRGGYRSIILFRQEEKAFFVYGFAKNQQANISPDELQAFKVLAAEVLNLPDEVLEKAIIRGKYWEIDYEI